MLIRQFLVFYKIIHLFVSICFSRIDVFLFTFQIKRLLVINQYKRKIIHNTYLILNQTQNNEICQLISNNCIKNNNEKIK